VFVSRVLSRVRIFIRIITISRTLIVVLIIYVRSLFMSLEK
jgi:hypothetical protein